VLRVIAGSDHERAFRRVRDEIYRIRDEARREEEFDRIHLEWFQTLDLSRPLIELLREFPILDTAVDTVLVCAALKRSDEGADLLVPIGAYQRGARHGSGSVARPTLSIRVRPALFAASEALVAVLRRELLLVSDMLDPSFGYEPDFAAAKGGVPAPLLVERYKTFWQASALERLASAGLVSDAEGDRSRRLLATAFPRMTEEIRDWLAGIRNGAPPTHASIAALVRESLTCAPEEAVRVAQQFPGGTIPAG